MSTSLHHHRSGKLKQANKKHKTGHTSKRTTKKSAKGRIPNATGPKQLESKVVNARADRLNRAKQLREQKRTEVWLQQRIGSNEGPPKIVCVIGLSSNVDYTSIINSFLEGASSMYIPPQEQCGMFAVTASFQKQKQRFTFIHPSSRDLIGNLEILKVVDIVIFVSNVSNGEEGLVDETHDILLSAVKAQGMPSVIGVIQGLESVQGKKHNELRKLGYRLFRSEFGDDCKIADAGSKIQLERALFTCPVRTMNWRSIRSYLVADNVQVIEQENNLANIKISGFIRGRPLNVNQLVHIPGGGAYYIEKITKGKDPCPLKPINEHINNNDDDDVNEKHEEEEVLAISDITKREDIKMEADVDPIDREQTLISEEEIKQAEEELKEKKKTKFHKPKGMSDYQAAWLEGESDDDNEVDEYHVEDSHDNEDEEIMDISKLNKKLIIYGETGSNNTDDDDDDDDDNLSDDNESVTTEISNKKSIEMQRRRQLLALEDAQFPDEVDTPKDMTAKDRFARYRALKSWNTSQWDPNESLPLDYARIYKFENFLHAQKRILKETEITQKSQNRLLLLSSLNLAPKSISCLSGNNLMQMDEQPMNEDENKNIQNETQSDSFSIPLEKLDENCIISGTYVNLYINNIDWSIISNQIQMIGGIPLIISSLLKYENKLSVVHFNLQQHSSYEQEQEKNKENQPIKSKDTLLFICGFRKFYAKPIFSENNLNSDKHKFLRFLSPSGSFCCASVFASAFYQPAPVLVFKEIISQGIKKQILVATGNLLGVEPDRIILKKICLTGYPIKVHKKTAVIKYMFFNPIDIKWFKPAELKTKLGLSGHIREPLGTHGLMKCTFNEPIKQHDTVCLNLYKRVFPKFVNDKFQIF